MKTKTDYSAQFLAGWKSHDTGETNPHLLTSNYSDAFELGRFCRGLGFPDTIGDAAKKSRGYTWVVGATKFLVDGRTVKVISSHPVYC